MKNQFISLCMLILSISISDIHAAAPEELLDDLIEELASQTLPQPFHSSLVNRLESAARILSDSNSSNDSAAVGILESFINYVTAIGLDSEFVESAQYVIDAIEQTNGNELPDLTALAGPSDECSLYPAPGATLFLVGDISFSEGNASGFETFFVFGNSTYNNNIGLLECVVSYSLTGTHSALDNLFEMIAIRESSSCPSDLTYALFDATFNADYVMEFLIDGTSSVIQSDTSSPVGAGFWNEVRTVYSNDFCAYF